MWNALIKQVKQFRLWILCEQRHAYTNFVCTFIAVCYFFYETRVERPKNTRKTT